MKHYSCRVCGLITPERYCPEHKPRDRGSRGGSTRQWRKLRARVLARDGYRCQWGLEGCTGDATHADHVKPRSKGGPDTMANLVASCRNCNLKRGNRTPV